MVLRGATGCCHLHEPPTARPRGFQGSFQIAVDGSVLSLKHVGSSDHFTVVRMDDSDGVFQVVRGFCWLVYGSTGRFVDTSQATKRSQAPLLFSTGQGILIVRGLVRSVNSQGSSVGRGHA